MPLTEAAAAYVAKKILDQVVAQSVGGSARGGQSGIRRLLGRDPQRVACGLALTRAEARFATLHPTWHAALFDRTFLGGHAAPLLARTLTRTEETSGAELAQLWSERAIGGETGARHRAELEAPAADFLDFWREEIGRHQVFQAMLDSRASERVAVDLEQIAASAEAVEPALDELRVDLLDALRQLDRHSARAGYPHLEDFIDWPSRERVRGAPELAGREWVFDEIEEFAERHTSGYLHLVAEAGLGKSAIAAAFAARMEAAVFFFGEASGRTRPEQCLRHLCVELIRLYGLPHDRLPQGAGDDAGFLSRLIHEATARAGRVWIVIDALDEAQLGRGAGVMPLPEELPRGAFVLLTHRPGAYAAPALLNGSTGLETLRITPADPRQRRDVAALVRAEVLREPLRSVLSSAPQAGGFAQRLIGASEGNFMYVSLVLRHVVGSATPALDLDALPVGLDGYYGRMWSVIAAEAERDWQDWQRLQLPVIELLAVAGEPVGAAWLSELVDRPPAEVNRRALHAWRRFLMEADAKGQKRWRIVHQSFRDFLGATDEVDIAAAHQRVAAANSTPEAWHRHDGYALRHLSAHHREAGEISELFALVDDASWRVAQYKADPTGAQFLNDLQTAWNAAIDADEQTVASAGERRLLRREVLCAVGACHVHQSSRVIPPGLMARALEIGVRSFEQVLAATRLVPGVADRADVLATIAPVVPLPALPDLLEIALALPDGLGRVRVIAAALPRLDSVAYTRLASRAWEIVPALTQGDRVTAVQMLAAVTDADLAPNLDALAEGLPGRMQDHMAAALLPAAPSDRRFALTAQALAGAERGDVDEMSTASLLAAAGRWATASQVRQALRVCRALTRSAAYGTAMAGLLPRLAAADRDEALQRISRDVLDGEGLLQTRAEMLRLLGEHVGPARAATAAARILQQAERTGAVGIGAKVLAVAAQWLTAEDSAVAVDRMFERAERTGSTTRLAAMLTALAPLLNGPQLTLALDVAPDVAEPFDRSALLSALAPRMSADQVRKALDDETTQNPARHGRLLAAALPMLSGADRVATEAELRATLAAGVDLRATTDIVDALARVDADGNGQLILETLDRLRPNSSRTLIESAARLIEWLPRDRRWTALSATAERLSSAASSVLVGQYVAFGDVLPPMSGLDWSFQRSWSTTAMKAAIIQRLHSEGIGLSPTMSIAIVHDQELWRTSSFDAIASAEANAEELLAYLNGLPKGPARCRLLILVADHLPQDDVLQATIDLGEGPRAAGYGSSGLSMHIDALTSLRARLSPEEQGMLMLQDTLDRWPHALRQGSSLEARVAETLERKIASGPREWRPARAEADDPTVARVLGQYARPIERVLVFVLAKRAPPGSLVEEAFEQLTQGGKEPSMGTAYALELLAPHLPREATLRALEIGLGTQHGITSAGSAELARKLRADEAELVLDRWMSGPGSSSYPRRLHEALFTTLPPARHGELLAAMARLSDGRHFEPVVDIKVHAPFADLFGTLVRADPAAHFELLTYVIRRLDARGYVQLVKDIEQVPVDERVDATLRHVAELVPVDALSDVLKLLGDEAHRAAVLVARAAELPGLSSHPLPSWLDRVDSASERAAVAKALAAVAGPDDAEPLLAAAAALPRSGQRAAVVAALAPTLPDALVPRALHLITASPDVDARVTVLVAIAEQARRTGVPLHRACSQTLQLAAAAGERSLRRCFTLLGPIMAPPTELPVRA